MFCPECKAEYRIGFIRCRDCGVELVDNLPQDTTHDTDAPELDYVVVHTVYDQLEADQICSFLRGNGIAARIAGERFRHPYGIGITGTWALQILVPEEFSGNAASLLVKADRGELEIHTDDGNGNTTHTLGGSE